MIKQKLDLVFEPFADPHAFPDIYAMCADGICMTPVIDDGAVIAFSKVRKLKPDDCVALWFRPGYLPGGVPQVQVKRFIGWNSSDLIVERFVPHAYFSVSLENLLAIHVAIGTFPSSRDVGGMHSIETLCPFPTLRVA